MTHHWSSGREVHDAACGANAVPDAEVGEDKDDDEAAVDPASDDLGRGVSELLRGTQMKDGAEEVVGLGGKGLVQVAGGLLSLGLRRPWERADERRDEVDTGPGNDVGCHRQRTSKSLATVCQIASISPNRIK